MALSAKLQVRQSQSLVITPQLMQAIRLLQMSGLELERFVSAELEANPLLAEHDETEPEIGGELSEADLSGPGRALDQADEAPRNEAAGNEAEAPEILSDYSDVADWMPSGGSCPGTQSRHDNEFGLDFNLRARESLPEFLEHRIDAAFAGAPSERMIARSLLAGLDEAGYLTVTLESLATRLGLAEEAIERVLLRCQELAPTGLFARSLAECLALQLAERNRLDPAMQALLANLERLAAGERAGLCAVCGVDRADLDDMIAEIRALDPKPGLGFSGEAIQAVIPDVFVRHAPGGGWIVELNDAALPRLIVNRIYHAKLSARSPRDGEKRFLADCLQKASWLEKSLDQRARTVLSVASEIVRRQEGFLEDGVAYLRPLNLRMVADTLGVHESTVSRAAANKTIATPRGIFEFRYFFTGAIPASSGHEAHSAESVRHRIRKLVQNELPESVLSDDGIVTLLSREGIEIARRTVAKYREAMRIGSSVERRREKRLRAAS